MVNVQQPPEPILIKIEIKLWLLYGHEMIAMSLYRYSQ